jgi:hypothetical protein
MNANRRLEEFILKLSTRQNDHNLFKIINEIRLKSYYNDPHNNNNPDNKANNNYLSIDKT